MIQVQFGPWNCHRDCKAIPRIQCRKRCSKSAFICDPSWLGSFDGGVKIAKLMIISMRIGFLGDFLNFSRVRVFFQAGGTCGFFLIGKVGPINSQPICYFYVSCFCGLFRVGWLQYFAYCFLRNEAPNFCWRNNPMQWIICVTYWWKLAQLRVFFFDENKLEEMFSQSCKNHQAFVLACHLR